jgi:flagellar hook-basal body complex protein FliE
MALPVLNVTPQAAASAYRGVEAGTPALGTGFGAALGRALESVVETGRTAENKAAAGLTGTGNITEVVTAVAKAELTLQTSMAVRDRVVQAYQDIMRMPI